MDEAGWGLVSVPATATDHTQVVVLAGPVETNPASSGYAGATKKTNNTGELTAALRALQHATVLAKEGLAICKHGLANHDTVDIRIDSALVINAVING